MNSILRVSDAAALGIHAMLHIARAPSGAPVSVSSAASEFGVSEAHLHKVMQRMVRAGLVSSRRGPSGGFTLARPPSTISLLDILESIDGPIGQCTCLLGRPSCPSGGCVLGPMVRSITDQVRGEMSRRTLSDVTRPNPPRRSRSITSQPPIRHIRRNRGGRK